MSEHKTKSEAEAVESIVRTSALVPTFHTVTGDAGQPPTHLATVPNGMQLVSVEDHLQKARSAPKNRGGTASLTDLDSFISHVRRFSDDDSVIFLDENRQAPKLVAVLDYNRQGPEGAPRFGCHKSSYAFPVSDEWRAWTSKNKAWMGVEEFAAFLEEHLIDVVATHGETAKDFAKLFGVDLSSPVRLLELSKGLSIHVGARVEKHVNLSTGEGQVHFAETHQGAGGTQLKIPGAFAIGIPVFRNGHPYEIPARLRYRVAGGSITWAYDLHRFDAAFDEAIRDAAEKAGEATGRAVLFGTPEA